LQAFAQAAREIPDALAVAMEHERRHAAGLLQPSVNRELFLEDLLDVGGERKRPPFAVLRAAWVQTDAATCPVDVPPFQRKHFTGCAPAGGEGEAAVVIVVILRCSPKNASRCNRILPCTANR
jgi:hypothetical protein